MNRNELVDRCKAIIQKAYGEATEMIVAYLELHPGEQRQTLAKEIDPENWQALDARIRRRQAARKASSEAETSPTTSPEWVKQDQRAAARIARETPDDLTARLSPTENAALAAAADKAVREAGKAERQESERRYREDVGDDTADELENQQRLHDAEGELFKARRALRDALAILNESDIDQMRDSWQEDVLLTIDDLEARVQMLRLFFTGGEVSDADLAQLLREVK